MVATVSAGCCYRSTSVCARKLLPSSFLTMRLGGVLADRYYYLALNYFQVVRFTRALSNAVLQEKGRFVRTREERMTKDAKAFEHWLVLVGGEIALTSELPSKNEFHHAEFLLPDSSYRYTVL